MADDTTKVTLDLDNAEFVSKLKESIGLMDEFANVERFVAFAEKLVEVGIVLAPIVVTFLAIKAALDMTEEAEHLEQINNSFQMLAQSAGLAADALRDRLLVAVGGLATESETLQAANKAIVTMGQNAAHLPEIMEIARKATILFGGSVIENFNNLSQALATGNQRMLRHYGIVIDVTKAHQNYAKQLGVGVEFLSQAGARQAMFNAGLESAEKKFQDVDASSLKVTNNIRQIGVAFTEIKEAAVLAWDKIAGPTIQAATGKIADFFHDLANQAKSMWGQGEEKAKATKEILEQQVKHYKELLEKGAFLPGQTTLWERSLARAEAELAKINAREERSAELAMHKGQVEKQISPTPSAKPPPEFDPVNQQKLKEAKLKFEQDILKIREEREKAEEKVETDALNLHKVHDQEILTLTLKANEEIRKLDTEGLQKGLISQEQFERSKKDIIARNDAQIKQIRTKYYEDEVNALKNLQTQNQNAAAGFAAAWKKNTAQAQADLRNFGKLGDTTFAAVKNHAVEAFKAMGNGSKNAGDAIKGFLFGTIGDVAVAQGTEILMSSIWPPNPIGLAAGGALIAFGEALSSIGQSSGSSVPSAGGGGGGGGGGGASSADLSQAGAPTPAATQQKSLTIAFHGDYLDSDQSRTRFMDMIRQAGDFTDFNLVKVGQSS